VKKKEPLQREPARALNTRDRSWQHRPIDPAPTRQAPSPYDRSLSLAAVAWLRELPPELAPLTLAHQFPRIVNRLSRFWDSPQMIDECFRELLVDKRGKRKGFSTKILDEISALAEYYRALHKSANTDLWDSIPYRRRPSNSSG
jgi:hypothetical protein